MKQPFTMKFLVTYFVCQLVTYGALLEPCSNAPLSPLRIDPLALVVRAADKSPAPGSLLRSFGININESLTNPLEPGASVELLQQQVAVILSDLRTIGGHTARWIVTYVWPQWRCGLDPEAQETSEIDPAWFIVARTLLDEAERQDVKIVVVLSNLNESSFGGLSTDPSVNSPLLGRWAKHRRSLAGKDGYGHEAIDCVSPDGYYYGATQPETIFADSAVRGHLGHRFAEMAKFLAAFPALGAIELFNEPKFELTHSPMYWAAVKELLATVRGADPRLSNVPVISGTAFWDETIATRAAATGALDQESFLSVHVYEDYSQSYEIVVRRLQGLISYLHRIVPGKPVVIAEAGSKVPLTDAGQNANMVRSLLNVYIHSDVGVWVWGNWISEPDTGDYKLTFNHRSPVGESFRPFFFSVEKELNYASTKAIPVTPSTARASRSVAFDVGRIDDSDPDLRRRGKWSIEIDGRRFVGFSRAGIFPKPFSGSVGFSRNPPPMYFITDRGPEQKWAKISYSPTGWILEVFACTSTADSDPATPTVLTGLAANQRRDDFETCLGSHLLFHGAL
jgi:hypothetical protein